MALHGTIEVNSVRIGYWGAQRVADGPDGVNTYDCVVRLFEQAGRAATKATATVQHRYDDGAAVLAAKVLAACT